MKRPLMSWVVVIPKGGWAHVAAPLLLLARHWLFRFFLQMFFFFAFLFYFSFIYLFIYFWRVCVIPKEGWMQPCTPILLFVWQQLRTLGTFLCDAAHFSNSCQNTTPDSHSIWDCGGGGRRENFAEPSPHTYPSQHIFIFGFLSALPSGSQME